jgi:hypothetical protein
MKREENIKAFNDEVNDLKENGLFNCDKEKFFNKKQCSRQCLECRHREYGY